MRMNWKWYLKFALLVALCCVPTILLFTSVRAAWHAYQRPFVINRQIAAGVYHAETK